MFFEQNKITASSAFTESDIVKLVNEFFEIQH